MRRCGAREFTSGIGDRRTQEAELTDIVPFTKPLFVIVTASVDGSWTVFALSCLSSIRTCQHQKRQMYVNMSLFPGAGMRVHIT